MTRRPNLAPILAPAALVLLAGCASTGGVPQRAELTTTLTGQQAAPQAGDLDGTGTARFRVNAAGGEVCWTMAIRGIDPATAAHIHRGAAGSAGPPVVTLTTPGADGQSTGCAAVDRDTAQAMIRRASDFYVNIHNQAYPAGAIRGQLRGQVFNLRERDR